MSYYEEFKIRSRTRSNRYRNCKILKDKETGTSIISTRDIESIPESQQDRFHTVKTNEVGRLDLIAYEYYKNALYWWVIAQANDIYDPITGMTPNMILRIPSLETLYGYKGILL